MQVRRTIMEITLEVKLQIMSNNQKALDETLQDSNEDRISLRL